MNKLIKKVVYFVAIAVFLSVGNSVSASFPFNSDPADCPTISVGNYNTGVGVPTGGSTSCQNWSLNRVDAEAGDTINVHIYYHNTSSAPANDVKVNLVQSNTGPSTSFSISGTLASRQGNTAMGPVTVNLNSAQTLTFLDLAWFPNQTAVNNTPTPLPGGQSGSSIMSGGVSIGDVGNTKPAYQGNFVASFRVGNKTVINPPTTTCSITSFYSSNVSGSGSNAVRLYWTTNGANYVEIDGVRHNGSSGDIIVYPGSSRTYNIVAFCNNGATDTDSTYVNIYNQYNDDPSATTNSPRDITEDSATLRGVIDGNGSQIDGWFEMPCRSSNRYGEVYNVSSRTLSTTRHDLSPNRTYRYCAVARNNSTGVTVYGDEEDFRTEDEDNNNYDELTLTTNRPTNISQNSATLNGYIDANGNNATRWFRYGTTTSSMYMTTNTVNHGSGSKNVSDTVYNLSPNTTYYYQVIASDIDGTHYDANIQQFNTNASIINNNGSTSAVTTIATNVSRSGAQLNGLLMNTSTSPTSTYFEYGTTVTMGNRTNSKLMSAGTSLPLSDYITGLAPNTDYFFRANAENANGRVFGSIETFRTNANAAPVTPTVITRVGTESPIMLKIENRYEIFRIGDLVDYTVTYKNIGRSTLTNPLLQVVLPQHVAFTNSSRGTYAAESHTLNVQLETLTPNAEGVVYLQGRVISLPANRAQIVTTALLNYTNPNGAQEDAMAYVLNRDDLNFNNDLSANALFASGFMPDTLCGWLLLIIIIILIALLIRWLLAGRDERNRARYNNSNHL
jgi:uncharacterized repeat protein (TIGR01451 family)